MFTLVIFISYAKKDIKWRDKLLIHLRGFGNEFFNKIWVDLKLVTGEKWNDELEKKRNEASIAILLVSPNYLASDFIIENELNYFLENKSVKIFWFLIAPCAWEEKKLQLFQCANVYKGEKLISLKISKDVDSIFATKTKEIYNIATSKVPYLSKNINQLNLKSISFKNDRYILTDEEGKSVVLEIDDSILTIAHKVGSIKNGNNLLVDLIYVIKNKNDNDSKNLLKKIDEYLTEVNSSDIEFNSVFELLSNLDFKFQDEKFNLYLNKRKFNVFVIRGDGCCGQNWLWYQLTNKYLPDNDKLIFNGDIQNDLESIVNEMINALSCQVGVDDHRIKFKYIVKKIIKRLETRHQVILFRNFYHFVCSKQFEKFSNYFLEMLNDEVILSNPQNRLVVFFVEEIAESYMNMTEVECCYLDKVNNSYLAKFNYEYLNKPEKLKIIALNEIDKIDNQMVENWVASHVSLSTFAAQYFDNSMIDVICSSENADDVMYNISKIFNYENQWTKF